MTRTVNVKLTGIARGGELLAVVGLSSIRPHCIDYRVAKVTVDVDGREVSCQVTGLTEDSALTSVAQWLIETFDAKAAAVSPPQRHELGAAA